MLTIVRAVIMYRPLMFFVTVAMVFIAVGIAIGISLSCLFLPGKWEWTCAIADIGDNDDYYRMPDFCNRIAGRYYFSKVGIYLGADVNVDRWDWGEIDDTKFSFGAEAGYAFFLSRTVTIEPAVFWNVNSDRSKFGLKVGFGFYF